MKVKVIIFTGIDGSGKTMVSNIIAALLMKKKFKVKVLWIKSLHTIAYLVYCLFRKIWGIEYIVNPKGIIVEHFITQYMRKMSRIWGLIEFMSVIPWIFIVNIFRYLNYIVICDRYLVDFLVTVSLRTGNTLWWARSIPGKFLLILQAKIPTIHLKISTITALKRRPSIEYDLNEFKTLTATYRIIAKIINAIEIINENRNLKEVVREVVEKLELIS